MKAENTIEAEDVSIDAMLDGLERRDRESQDETTLSVWVETEWKRRYNNVQRLTRKQFAGKLREIVKAAIVKAEIKLGA